MVLLEVLMAPPSRPAAAYDVCADDNACIHEYMAEQALELYTNNEIDAYFNSDIRVGTGHEDEADHIYSLSWFAHALVTITHFWDSDNGPDDPVVNVIGTFPNGWHKVKAFWSLAQGAYAKGDKAKAYHWLGHVVHHMGDNTLPTHVHDDMHWPDDDAFEEWMSLPNLVNASLTQDEKDDLEDLGPIDIPSDKGEKLYWLMYQQNQIADFFGSDDYDGDAVDPNGWVQDELDAMVALGAVMPRTMARLDNNDDDEFGFDYDNNDDGDLSVIRQYSYLRGIRTIAALYKLFDETVRTQVSAVVVIDHIEEIEDHDYACVPVCVETSDPDFFSVVSINGRTALNRGDEIVDDEVVDPGWAYGHVTGASGSIPIWIEIWDHDGTGEDVITLSGADDISNISPNEGSRLDITLDLAKCLNHEAGAISGEVSGNCGDSISTVGENDDADDDDDGIAQMTFRVFLSKSAPVADAGGPHTTPEGTNVTLDASGSTDADNDITSYAWDLDEDGACDDAFGVITSFSTVGQDDVTTVKVCVTDAVGFTDDDTTTVTVTNVIPTISMGSSSTINEGASRNVSGSISDPGWLEALTATINWGDGTGPQGLGAPENVRPDQTISFNLTHSYGDNGVYTVTINAADDDSTPSASITLTVNNLDPTVVLDIGEAVTFPGGTYLVVEAGTQLDLAVDGSDPGSDDLEFSWSSGEVNEYFNDGVGPDPLPSPLGTYPFNASDSTGVTWAVPGVESVGVVLADDDLATDSDGIGVIVTGTADDTQPLGWWKLQYSGKGKPQLDAPTLAGYLEIVRAVSSVYSELVPLATNANAKAVLSPTGGDQRKYARAELLVAWLNFASGSVDWDATVPLDSGTTTAYLALMFEAEAVVSNPGSTQAQLLAIRQKLDKVLLAY